MLVIAMVSEDYMDYEPTFNVLGPHIPHIVPTTCLYNEQPTNHHSMTHIRTNLPEQIPGDRPPWDSCAEVPSYLMKYPLTMAIGMGAFRKKHVSFIEFPYSCQFTRKYLIKECLVTCTDQIQSCIWLYLVRVMVFFSGNGLPTMSQ